MTRRYDAFLIRHWSLDAGRERTEVTHLQSGAIEHTHTLTQTLEWMRARLTAREQVEETSDGAPARGPPIPRRRAECPHQKQESTTLLSTTRRKDDVIARFAGVTVRVGDAPQ